MKKVKVEDAIGMELCHDITAMFDGFKGALFKRGHIIQEEDVKKLLDIGKRSVFIWEENAGEIHEEEAARRLAALSEPEGAHYEGPSEGKMTMIADTQGMLRINKKLIREINAIGDITITSLPDHYPVKPGMKVASMRIIPLVTQEKQIEDAEKLAGEAADRGEMRFAEILPYRERKVGIIITGYEIYSGRIKDKFEPIVREKLAKYPSEILGVTICNDEEQMIMDAAMDFMAKGADLILFSGGMSVDPDDLTPSSIRDLGADIVSYGVPAQPGNMTLVAYLGDTCLLGVPGAAIKQPITVWDVLLPAVYSGEKITKEDLLNLQEGGLCQVCKVCTFPNCTYGRY